MSNLVSRLELDQHFHEYRDKPRQINMDMQAHYASPECVYSGRSVLGENVEGGGVLRGVVRVGEEVAQPLYMEQMLVKKGWQNLLF